MTSVEWMGPGSFRWCSVIEQGATGTKWNTGFSSYNQTPRNTDNPQNWCINFLISSVLHDAIMPITKTHKNMTTA